MRLEDIKDPKLKARVLDALEAAEALKADLRRDCPGPPSGHPQGPETPGIRLRQSKKPILNGLEEEFFEKIKREHPDCAPYIRPQAVRFRLGNGIWYRPDLTCMWGLVCRAWEVKGPHSFRGGFENLKVAASTYPEWIFQLVWKEDGQWKEQNILP